MTKYDLLNLCWKIQNAEFAIYKKRETHFNEWCWLVVGLSSIVTRRTWDYRWNALIWGISKLSKLVFKEVSEKIMENSERLGQQERPRI